MIENRATKMLCNIDWLEVHCIEADYQATCKKFLADGYRVDIKQYGTRVYRQVFDVFTADGVQILHICRDPYSMKGREPKGVLPWGSCHIKVHNAILYMEDPVEAVLEFLNKYNYSVRGISRIDLCCDFQKFWNGANPANFLRSYVRGKYHKINQGNFQVFGEDNDTKAFHSIKWGSPSSKIKTRLYNKTKELSEVSDKPYIRDVWYMSGFSLDADTWRVEFEIGSQGRQLVDNDTAEYVEVNLSSVRTPQGVEDMFLRYATHYFKFTKAEGTKRKDRCKAVQLFPDVFEGSEFHPTSNTPATKTDKTDRLVINYLGRQIEEVPGYTIQNKLTLLNAMKVIMQTKRLMFWYNQNKTACLPSYCINPSKDKRRDTTRLLTEPKENNDYTLVEYGTDFD